MQTILLVAAEAKELRGILRRCQRPERLGWPLRFSRAGELAGQRLLMVADGPGRELALGALRLALGRQRVDAVVSTGWCGALEPDFAPGEIFVASRVEAAGEHMSYTAGIPRTGQKARSGCLVTVDRVVRTIEHKVRLRQAGAAAVDMEAAAVASEARAAGIPFFCVRVVLDLAGEDLRLDLEAARDRQGRFSRGRILRAALARPRLLIPELIRLERRSRLAARALGDFVAECRFEP